jgi:hypothetical protein
MAAIRYGIAGQPVEHSLSPLLTALVADHLGLPSDEKNLKMELLNVNTVHDALAWGYAGAFPTPVPWMYTKAKFGTFRTSALLQKSTQAANKVTEPHPSLASHHPSEFVPRASLSQGLPTRMFKEEIWINLTAPLKHQLDSGAVVCLDDSMTTKSVNVLRWDGRGWWCAGVDGEGVRQVLHHQGFDPAVDVLGLCGGGGGARSTAAAWAEQRGSIRAYEGRRPLEEGSWTSALTLGEPSVVVDFDDAIQPDEVSVPVLKAGYRPMNGSVENRIHQLSHPHLDGRWMLVAQHLACWRHVWAPERGHELPDLGLLLTRLLHAEAVLSEYAT